MSDRVGRAVLCGLLISLHVAAVAAADPPTAATVSDRATAVQSFADVDYWSKVFDDPKRDAWQKPKELVAALGLQARQTVADLGAGTGYFDRYLADAVGPDGSVFAVEVEPTLVAHLRERAQREGAANVVPVLASIDNPRLPVAGIDLIFIADTYHHLDHRTEYLPRLRRALRLGGRVAVVDWKPGTLPEGPPPEHKLARERVLAEMQTAGFTLLDPTDLLPYQYVLIFRSNEPR
jgi:predicted methyltransferase